MRCYTHTQETSVLSGNRGVGGSIPGVSLYVCVRALDFFTKFKFTLDNLLRLILRVLLCARCNLAVL